MVTPTSTTETTGPLAGMLVFTDNNEIIRTGLAAAVIVVIGKAVTFDAAGRAIPAIATSNNADGIGIATINPNSPIGSQTGTIDNTSGAAEVDAARDFFGLASGRYFGHPKEEKSMTAAVATDIIAVRLGL